MNKSNNNVGNNSSYVWREDRLINKDICFECGLTENIHYHHVVPESKGGTNTIPLCPICHGKVHGKNFLNHKELQRLGIEKAKLEGKYMGRNKGTKESIEKFLSKQKNLNIINLLKQKKSYDEISKILNCSKTTIAKVSTLYREHYGETSLPIWKGLVSKMDNEKYKINDWMNEI